MDLSIGTRFKNAWNAFTLKNPINYNPQESSYNGSYYRPDRVRLSRGNERSIVTSIFNRIALDVASLDFCHCKLDDEDRFKETMKSSLNNCLTLEANLDQTSRAFIQDVILSMFDEGCVAIIPIDTDINPNDSSSYDILTMRTGKIVTWYPDRVLIEVYNDRKGRKEEIYCRKENVAIIENPLYSVMNEPNSTLQRLIRKLILLDSIDEQSGSGKLDLIIQLPYVIRSEGRRMQAEERRKDIEKQLSGSKYGIAYTDGTEKITQLNRPIENNLLSQIEYLTSMLYSQLGITQSILDGTADDKTLTNYYSRTIEPIISTIVLEIKRKFLTKTARTQGQSIEYFMDPFKLVPVKDLAELADKFTRNEILTSNEFRGIVGYKPSDNPKADQLVNSNIPQPAEVYENQNGVVSEEEQQYTDEEIDNILSTLTEEQKIAVSSLIDQLTEEA